MTPVLDRLLAGPPPSGRRIEFVRLDGRIELDLAELYEQSGRLAVALADLGLRPGDRIGVLAGNGLPWVLLDLAATRLKLVTAGFEPGKFTPGRALVERYGLALLFTDRPVTPADDDPRIRPADDAIGLAEKVASADPSRPPVLAYDPDEVFALKFTSGSSGEPKGLGASAGSVNSSLAAVQQLFGHGPDDRLFLFLPLSLLQQRYWIYSALVFGHDLVVSSYEAAFPALRQTRPTVVMGVPGFYETAMRFIAGRAARQTDPGAARAELARGFFGGRIRYLWTGSAPARRELLDFFTDAGLPLYEGYGLNETCIVAKNEPGAHKPGSVGRVLPGKTVRIGADGVISVHSEHPVAAGYAYAPSGDSERMFIAPGVVRTGDLGHLDEDGFLFIHGRADDVIVLDNGRKVVVRPIEERLTGSPAITEAVVLCRNQTSLAAVIVPAAGADRAEIEEHVAATNAERQDDERIDRVVLAPEGFSVANGLLSEQFKPRRARIAEQFRSELAR